MLFFFLLFIYLNFLLQTLLKKMYNDKLELGPYIKIDRCESLCVVKTYQYKESNGVPNPNSVPTVVNIDELLKIT